MLPMHDFSTHAAASSGNTVHHNSFCVLVWLSRPAALHPFVMVVQGAAGAVHFCCEVVGRVQRVLFWQGWCWSVPVGIKLCIALFTWYGVSVQVGSGTC